MIDFALCICGHGESKDATLQALDFLRRASDYRWDLRMISGDALIGRSRSRMCTQFLKHDDTPYMIFLDSDILFSPGDIKDIYDAMTEGHDVVAGAYSVANGAHLAIRTYEEIKFDRKIHEAEFVSTGFMGISRKILEKIRDDLNLPLLHKDSDNECYPFMESGRYVIYKDNGEVDRAWYISEDWDFCNKVREVGSKVYIHTNVQLGHIKNAVIKVSDVMKKED